MDDRLRNICDRLNNITNQMDAEKIMNLSLVCDIRKNYARIKLNGVKSKLCLFFTKLFLKKPKRRQDFSVDHFKLKSMSCTRRDNDCDCEECVVIEYSSSEESYKENNFK